MEYGSLRPPLGDGYSMEASGTIIIFGGAFESDGSRVDIKRQIFEQPPPERQRLNLKQVLNDGNNFVNQI